MTITRDALFGSLNSSSTSEATVVSSACLRLTCADVEPLCIFVETQRLAGKKKRDETESGTVSTVATPF